MRSKISQSVVYYALEEFVVLASAMPMLLSGCEVTWHIVWQGLVYLG